MGFEPLLKFDGNGCYEAMGESFDKVVADLCDTILAHAQANLVGEYPEVEATLRSSLLSLAQSGLIDGQIGSDHWMAFIAEWGSGSEMDWSNPALSWYMTSAYWNDARYGYAIQGRPAGAYLGLDDQMHDKHTGYLAGVNLEVLSRTDTKFQQWMASVGLPPDAFQPKRPLHFLQEAVEANRSLIMDQLNAVIEVFQFGDFFV